MMWEETLSHDIPLNYAGYNQARAPMMVMAPAYHQDSMSHLCVGTQLAHTLRGDDWKGCETFFCGGF